MMGGARASSWKAFAVQLAGKDSGRFELAV